MVLTWKGLPDLETVQSQTPADKIKRRADRQAEQPDLISRIIIQKRKSIKLIGSSAALFLFTLLLTLKSHVKPVGSVQWRLGVFLLQAIFLSLCRCHAAQEEQARPTVVSSEVNPSTRRVSLALRSPSHISKCPLGSWRTSSVCLRLTEKEPQRSRALCQQFHRDWNIHTDVSALTAWKDCLHILFCAGTFSQLPQVKDSACTQVSEVSISIKMNFRVRLIYGVQFYFFSSFFLKIKIIYWLQEVIISKFNLLLDRTWDHMTQILVKSGK